MKIIIFNNLYFPFNKGGAENYILNQVQDLNKQGHQVIIVCTKKLFSQHTKYQNNIYYLNSLYYNLNNLPKFIRLFWHLKQLVFSSKNKKIKKILLKERPDLAITHNLLGLSWQIPKILKKLNIKHHHTLHDVQALHPAGLIYFNKEKILDSLSAKLYQKIIRYYFKDIEYIISPSHWLLKMHLRYKFFLQAKYKINSYDPKNFPQTNWPKKIKKILFVGQLEKHKGIDLILKYARLKNNIELSIVGDGSLKSSIINNKNVSYLGKKSKKEILEEMKKHDCLIVPSICYENIPMVIIEAFSQQLAVVASKIGGIVELADDFNIKLFNPKDLQSLNKIIENDANAYLPEEQK